MGAPKSMRQLAESNRDVSPRIPNHVGVLVEQDEYLGEALRAESVIMSCRPAGGAPEMPAGIQ